jgi:hypothetical protein
MAANPIIIPASERFGKMRELLDGFVDIVARLRNENPQLVQQWPQFFLFLTYPWIVDHTLLTADQRTFLERRTKEIQDLGFDGDATKKKLEEILANDTHLRDCCATLLNLANFLDTFYITSVADAKRHGAAKERLDYAYDEFESLAYHQGRFKRIALSHIFNFEIDGNSAIIEGSSAGTNIRIERLDASTIPRILGESGFQAFLHPTGIGNCFVVEEEIASAVDDINWINDKRQKALFFAQVLQYFQDGVVHIGYSVPVFHPPWVNQIRRFGLFFLGEPRRTPYLDGSKPYAISAASIERLGKWWKAATSEELVRRLANKNGKLRQAIYRAGEYYESNHSRLGNVERLLDLAIALESLFSPTDKGELKFRISQSAAQFIGSTPAEREHLFKAVSTLYDRRSKLVHGSYDVHDYDSGRFVLAAEVDEWAAIVRSALVRFLAIYFRGDLNAPREPIMNLIGQLNFDDSKRVALAKQSDIESLFAELRLGEARVFDQVGKVH